MINIDDYVAMILTSEMTESQKISYLKTLNTIRNYTREQLQEVEDKIYTLDEKTLSEKERIIYEINYLNGYYKSREMDQTEIRKLYFQIKRVKDNVEELTKVKRNITRIQLENCLNIRFYNAYLDLLNESEKQNRRRPRTLHN